MKTQMSLTERERELIETIRNLQNSRHNYSYRLEDYARELFDRMIDEIKD